MRELIAVCRSRKRARARVAQALDRYLWRIGDRTWRGRASNACLERIARDLKSGASKATAVALYEVRSAPEARRPLFIVGVRALFGLDGVVPIAVTTKSARSSGTASPGLAALRSCIALAALFHDIGKATRLFQAKLRTNEPVADAIRHEVISLYAWDEITKSAGKGATDREILANLEKLTSTEFDRLFDAAGGWGLDLHSRARLSEDGRVPFQISILENPASERKLAQAVALLIVSHHRLYEGSHTGRPLARQHVNAGTSVTLDGFACAEGSRPWYEEAWLTSVHRAARELAEQVESLSGTEIPGVYALGRTALMIGDHLGSSEKQAASDWNGILANTIQDDGKRLPADSLNRHLSQVARASRQAFAALTRFKDAYPAIAPDVLPLAIADPRSPEGSRFAWQGAGARLAYTTLLQHPGAGFFACLLAATGTGKTRGAPAVLSAACRADPNSARQGLRYNLALGLRTLARQSGLEYVRDLGFQPVQVAVLAGGVPIDPSAAAPADTSGSEYRDLAPGLEVSHPEADVPEDGSETSAWLAALESDPATVLPSVIQRAVNASRAPSAFAQLVATPILSATIDHFMPAADARRGSHLPAIIRVATSDLILDEVDLFEGEDLSAIGRLVFLSASFGGASSSCPPL